MPPTPPGYSAPASSSHYLLNTEEGDGLPGHHEKTAVACFLPSVSPVFIPAPGTQRALSKCLWHDWMKATEQQSLTFSAPRTVFVEERFSPHRGSRQFQEDSSALHLLGTFFLLLSHLLQLRSWRLGTPAVEG